MPKNLSLTLCEQTPTLAISDNRGLPIRTLAYNRRDNHETVDQLISTNRYNALGQLIASRDPRLEMDNFSYQYSLGGAPLRTDSVDSGSTLQLTDIAGRSVLTLDARHTRRWVEYERGERSLGRPLSYFEQTKGGLKTVTDRFFYGANSEQDRNYNLNGQCIRHYDSAGLQTLTYPSIIGVPLQQQRQLLADTLGPADWFGDDENWSNRLSKQLFIDSCTHDALGQIITQTDAKGHTQRMAYNRAGQLIGAWLTLKNGAEQAIIRSLTYSAIGQKLREESGNGVVTEYRYDPQNQRLIGIKTTRPAKKDRPSLLQDLRYDYDPVGNILAIHNDAEATRFYRNQKIVPETTYRYDALYQLIEATGREADSNSMQNSQLPELALLNDRSQWVNYTRRYSYDRAGNLLKIQHTGASQYSTDITVSDSSNHGIRQQNGIKAGDVRRQFDAAGNQRRLQPGQLLKWNARNQLQQVESIHRDDNISDSESYIYDGGGMRVVKTSVHKTHNAVQSSTVIYLAGLELRSQYNNNNLTEDFQVITLGTSGRAQVRVLHWDHGQPDNIPNNQLRYSFDNQIGSALIELDSDGDIISQEEYYPFGGTAVWAARNTVEADYKTVRYSGKERDATGLYYYGYRYYMPWLGRWLSADPAETIDGLNLYRMVRNNPITLMDEDGLAGITPKEIDTFEPYVKDFEKGKITKEKLFTKVMEKVLKTPSYKKLNIKISQLKVKAQNNITMEILQHFNILTFDDKEEHEQSSHSEYNQKQQELDAIHRSKTQDARDKKNAIQYLWATNSGSHDIQNRSKLNIKNITGEINRISAGGDYFKGQQGLLSYIQNSWRTGDEASVALGEQINSNLTPTLRHYRGVSAEEMKVIQQHYDMNKTYVPGRFLAVSSSKTVAEKFPSDGTNGGVVLVSGNAMPIINIFSNQGEKEYLFARETKFNVLFSTSKNRLHLQQTH